MLFLDCAYPIYVLIHPCHHRQIYVIVCRLSLGQAKHANVQWRRFERTFDESTMNLVSLVAKALHWNLRHHPMIPYFKLELPVGNLNNRNRYWSQHLEQSYINVPLEEYRTVMKSCGHGKQSSILWSCWQLAQTRGPTQLLSHRHWLLLFYGCYLVMVEWIVRENYV